MILMVTYLHVIDMNLNIEFHNHLESWSPFLFLFHDNGINEVPNVKR